MKQKYKDKGTFLSYQRQIDKIDAEKSQRAIRREKQRELEKFTILICQYVTKEWWTSFSLEKQLEIKQKWSDANFRWHYHGFEQPNFENWLVGIKSIYKPDIDTYRDKIIDKLLDDNG